MIPLIIQDQFGILQNLQNLQTSPIPQTSFLVGTFFAVSYSKTALAILFLVHFGHSKPLCSKAACLFASPYCVYCAYLGKLLSSALHSGNIFSWFHIAQFLIARCYNSSKSIEISLKISCSPFDDLFFSFSFLHSTFPKMQQKMRNAKTNIIPHFIIKQCK